MSYFFDREEAGWVLNSTATTVDITKAPDPTYQASIRRRKGSTLRTRSRMLLVAPRIGRGPRSLINATASSTHGLWRHPSTDGTLVSAINARRLHAPPHPTRKPHTAEEGHRLLQWKTRLFATESPASNSTAKSTTVGSPDPPKQASDHALRPANQNSLAPKPETSSAKTAVDVGGSSAQKTNAEQRRADWKIVRNLSVNIWPKGWGPEARSTKARVLLALGLLASGKVCALPNGAK